MNDRQAILENVQRWINRGDLKGVELINEINRLPMRKKIEFVSELRKNLSEALLHDIDNEAISELENGTWVRMVSTLMNGDEIGFAFNCKREITGYWLHYLFCEYELDIESLEARGAA